MADNNSSQQDHVSSAATSDNTNSELAGKYLTFNLASEEYGVEILAVREIIGIMDITHVPRAPHYIRGVINLRGKVIPVVDLRLKFDMESIDDTEETCIIVVETYSKGIQLMTGIVVDSVSEVLDIGAKEIEETPALGAGVDIEFILGMARTKDGIKILLDIHKVLNVSEIKSIGGVEEELAETEIEETAHE